MAKFVKGDRAVHRSYTGKECLGTIVGYMDGIFGSLIYFKPDKDCHFYGVPMRSAFGEHGLYAFYEKKVFPTGPPLTTQEKVIRKSVSLSERFKSKTLPKTKQKPLPLPH